MTLTNFLEQYGAIIGTLLLPGGLCLVFLSLDALKNKCADKEKENSCSVCAIGIMCIVIALILLTG